MMLNPILDVRTTDLAWKLMIECKIYHFELILPFKATSQNFIDMVYFQFCAKCLETQDIQGTIIEKDTLLIVNFPGKTFERVYNTINWNFRKGLKDDENVILQFEKESERNIKLISHSKSVCTEEQRKFAEETYKDLADMSERVNEREKKREGDRK